MTCGCDGLIAQESRRIEEEENNYPKELPLSAFPIHSGIISLIIERRHDYQLSLRSSCGQGPVKETHHCNARQRRGVTGLPIAAAAGKATACLSRCWSNASELNTAAIYKSADVIVGRGREG